MDSKHLGGNISHRRAIHHSGSYHDNLITFRYPWVVAWWAAALPGLGHLMLCKFGTGFILFIWEMVVNVNGGINEAIYYSMIGKVDKAKEILSPTWLFMYAGVYIFNIWDAYSKAVHLNRQYTLAYAENSPLAPFKISSLEVNFLDKRNPWLAVVFSAVGPGLGYLYIIRLPSAVFAVVWWVAIVYFSGIHKAILFTAAGDFAYSIYVLEPQWFLFIPSIYLFSMYDSYAYAVELNKIFEKEQANFLIKRYQHDPEKVLSYLKK